MKRDSRLRGNDNGSGMGAQGERATRQKMKQATDQGIFP
jgi:hypothetical protein